MYHLVWAYIIQCASSLRDPHLEHPERPVMPARRLKRENPAITAGFP
ncbi:hypothetical protein SAMN04488030_0164 [Aliiroseovarius halocynthiae]|nr:hypothetical protein SAMN04488030_0164 [Aliiroseovarius halocynthiae]